MFSKEKTTFKEINTEEIGKIEKISMKIDYKNLKYHVCKTVKEIDCSELENTYHSLMVLNN